MSEKLKESFPGKVKGPMESLFFKPLGASPRVSFRLGAQAFRQHDERAEGPRFRKNHRVSWLWNRFLAQNSFAPFRQWGRSHHYHSAGCLLRAILALMVFGCLEARAQESNQAALIHVEKGSQEHLLFPKALSLPVPSFSTPEQPPRSMGNVEQDFQEKRLTGNPLDTARTRLTIAWGYYNQARYQDAVRLFEDLTREASLRSIAEEARLGLAYSMIRLNRLSEAADLLEDLVTAGFRLEETAPPLVETLLTLKRYQDAEKYLPLLR